jgi:hypothetical protein
MSWVTLITLDTIVFYSTSQNTLSWVYMKSASQINLDTIVFYGTSQNTLFLWNKHKEAWQITLEPKVTPGFLRNQYTKLLRDNSILWYNLIKTPYVLNSFYETSTPNPSGTYSTQYPGFPKQQSYQITPKSYQILRELIKTHYLMGVYTKLLLRLSQIITLS